jgi:hypothetical protein
MANDFEMPDAKPILKVRPCEGCGGLPHVAAELCYLKHLREVRRELAALKAIVDDPTDFLQFKKLRAEVRALPLSSHEKLRRWK